MRRRKRNGELNGQFDESAFWNSYTYRKYYERLMDIGLSRYKWNNLPVGVDERFLETCLFEKGMAVFFYDDGLTVGDESSGYLALPCMIGGKLNVYNIPTQRTAYASNGYQNKLTEKDSVIIWNNRLHTPSISDVEAFARRLYNLDRTIDVNVMGQKTPIAILCTENQRLTMKNLYMQYEGNVPFIFGDKDLDINGIKAISTGAPYVSDKLYALKQQYWNEALTYLGVANVTTTKKERLINAEVNSTMGGVYASRLSGLKARQQACEEINRMFGLNISVEFNAGILDDNILELGGEEDE